MCRYGRIRMICAEIDFQKVGKAYHIFEAFVAHCKIAEISPLILVRKSAKTECLGRTRVEMGWSGFPCEFVAIRSPRSRMKYELKIFAEEFGDGKPCFRFCSRGNPHTNQETGDGLPARVVPTPHFHSVDKRGILQAYQTPLLEDPEEAAKIASNPQLGTNHFCQVANLFSPSGGSIVLKIIAGELDLSRTDPLDGANLPP